MNHKFVGFHLFLGHLSRAAQKTSHETDRRGARLHRREEKQKGKHGIVPEGTGVEGPQEHTGVNPHAHRYGNPPAGHKSALSGEIFRAESPQELAGSYTAEEVY